jgi:hypothetical protein
VTRYPKQARPLVGILALIVGLTLVAPPALAVQPQGPARPLAAAATAKVEALPAAAVAQAAQAAPAPAASTGNKPFFKSTKGIVVLVLMATGLGWAAVSRNQDAVHSPARK